MKKRFRAAIIKDKCPICSRPLIPNKKATRFGTKNWDGHTYKLQCSCVPDNIRISIG